jgi:hypothetical protein
MEDRHKQDGWDAYLIEQIERLKEAPPRNPKAHTAGKESFLLEARNLRNSLDLPLPVSNGPLSRLNNWKVQINELFRRKERIPMFTTVMSILVAFVLVFGGAGATAYAAQDSSPNDLLYPAKILSEDVQLSLARDANNQIDLLLAFNDRRLGEIADLVSANLPVPEKVADRIRVQISDALKLAADMDNEDEDLEEILTKIQRNLRDQDRVMTMLRTNIPEHADPVMEQLHHNLRNQMQFIDEGLEDPLTFQHRFRYRSNQDMDEPELEDILTGIVSESEEAYTEETPEDTPVRAGEEYGPGPEAGAGPEYGPGPQAGPEAEAGPQYGPGEQEQNGPGPETGAGPGPNEGSGSGGSDSGKQNEGAKEATPTSGSSKKRP